MLLNCAAKQFLFIVHGPDLSVCLSVCLFALNFPRTGWTDLADILHVGSPWYPVRKLSFLLLGMLWLPSNGRSKLAYSEPSKPDSAKTTSPSSTSFGMIIELDELYNFAQMTFDLEGQGQGQIVKKPFFR